MKNRLLIAFFGLAIFSFFSFQPPTLHPDIAAAKTWYEANITSPLKPNWAAAVLDIYSNGNKTVSLPVSNFSTYKWRDTNYPDTSQINGTTRIMIGKKPNEPYKASFLRFDFFHSSLTALGTVGLQNIRLNPLLLNSTSFNGICYAQNMADTSVHGGVLFENGVLTKSVYRRPAQNVTSVTDRGCIEILNGSQSYSLVPDASSSTGSALYIVWTWFISEIVCDNAAPWTNWGNETVGLGNYWTYPWGLPDIWSNYPGGNNTWNPPTPVPTDESQCSCFRTFFDDYFTHHNPVFTAPYYNYYWFNVNKTVLGSNCKNGTFSSGAFKVTAVPDDPDDLWQPPFPINWIHPVVEMNYCQASGSPVYVSPCKRKVFIVHDGNVTYSVVTTSQVGPVGASTESTWTEFVHSEQWYLFE